MQRIATMKYLLITLLLSTQANANLVKAPACGIGKVCVSEQFTCPIKKPVKAKKKLYKAPKQTVIPVAPVVEEKPCEITQNFYYDEIIAADYLGKLPHHPIENVTRPDSQPYKWNWTAPTYWGGIGYLYPVDREVIKTVYVSQPPPIATPLPAAFWLFGTALGLFVVRGKFGIFNRI